MASKIKLFWAAAASTEAQIDHGKLRRSVKQITTGGPLIALAMLLALFVLPAAAQIEDDASIKAVEIDANTPQPAAPPAYELIDSISVYNDTEFGELLYNEASEATRTEMLRLLTKDTPATMVFLQAVSMGLGIDDVLEAAVRYQPEKGREFARSAVSILPMLTESERYRYAGYDLDDVEEVSNKSYLSCHDVAHKFFNDREIMLPQPDWTEGQYHMLASAAELAELGNKQGASKATSWYSRPSGKPSPNRPIFVSLYEHNNAVLVDGKDRIEAALAKDGDRASLPVVFIYNRINERPLQELAELDYPQTIRGVQQAYSENGLMVTPSPEWEVGDYHMYAQMEELYEVFDIPEPQDFTPEQWQQLLAQAREFKQEQISLIIAVLSGNQKSSSAQLLKDRSQFAMVANPRDEIKSSYKSFAGTEEAPLELDAVLGKGVILNRPDMVAALNELGETQVPVSYYYLDNTRTKTFENGPRALRVLATGAGAPATLSGGGGGFGPPPPVVCASPPCN